MALTVWPSTVRTTGSMAAAASTDLGVPIPTTQTSERIISIWVAIAEKGIAMATPLRAGVYDYTALKPAPWGKMSGTGVFRLFGDLRAGLPDIRGVPRR